MKSVMVFGTFDHLHKGHTYFLKKASNYGSSLTAIVSTDAFVNDIKGKKPHHNQEKRMRMLEESGLVNQVRPSDYPIGKWQIIENERPDVVCLGHDQKAMQQSLEKWLKERKDSYKPEIITLSPYQRNKYSSSRISRNKLLANYALLFIAMLLWGYSWVSGKEASSEAHPLFLLFWRFVFSSTAFIPFALWERKKRKPSGKALGWTASSSLCLIIYNFLFFIGLNGSLASKGGVMVTSLIPLFTLFLSVLLLKEKIRPLQSIGIILGLSGGILLISPWKISFAEFLEGSNILFLAAALVWAVLTHLTRKAQQHQGIMTFNLILYSGAALAVLGLCYLYRISPFQFQGLTWLFWGNMLFLAIAAGAIGTGLYFRAGLKLGPSQASAFSFMVPGAALISSAVKLKERPDPLLLGAALLGSAAIILINWRKNEKK